MRVLLDEDLPHQLRKHLSGHDVMTAGYMGWNGIKNGELLRRAEAVDIEVLVTGDRNLSYQQNLAARTIAIVTLSATHWRIIQQHLEKIVVAVNAAVPGSFQEVDCGRFTRKRV